MPAFKEEHIIIIAPGSETTHAQLGLPESFTPARWKLKTRMFPAETPGKWEPHRIRKRLKRSHGAAFPQSGGTPAQQSNGSQPQNGDVPMADAPAVETEPDLEEDPISDVGAVWPMTAGRITNWSCFFALLEHVHDLLNPVLHTPVLVIAQPCWTPADHAKITKFFFEKIRPPGFAIMDSATAALYAYGIPTGCVIDVGKDKADVTAVTDFVVNDIGRGAAVQQCGGSAMTETLLGLLKEQGFTWDMCEQLKKSPICEILPAGTPIPGLDVSPTNGDAKQENPAAAASTGLNGPTANQAMAGEGARDYGMEAEGDGTNKDLEDNEGVLDVANIVTSGNMKEFLERKEQEKAARAKEKKKASEAAAATKPVKLRNSGKNYSVFAYEDYAAREAAKDSIEVESKDSAIAASAPRPEKSDDPMSGGNESKPPAPASADLPTSTLETVPASAPQTTGEPLSIGGDAAQRPPKLDTTTSAITTSNANALPSSTSPASAAPRSVGPNPWSRIIPVGPARFQALSQSYLDALTLTVYRVIQAVPSQTARSACWDNILITGAGSRISGFRDALIAALTSRFLITPSSATMFVSEIPSGFSTPGAGGTGATTPLPSGYTSAMSGGAPGSGAQGGAAGTGVNRLLHTAVTAHAAQSRFQPGGAHLTPGGVGTPTQAFQTATPPPSQFPGQIPQPGAAGHHFTQTPTTIRTVKLPEYFPEWKEPGAESECAFLGAQVAAKCVFLADVQGGSQKGFMSRTDYNEQGPQGISEYVM